MTTPALRMDLTSNPAEIASARKSIEAFAGAAGFDERATADIGLCVNEAIANIIRHAYGSAKDKPIEMHADMVADAMMITLRDWGNGRMPDLNKSVDPNTLCPGGLGLPCLKALLDGLKFEPQSDGMLLRMTKRKR
ncbi:MAG: serine phosphatase [Phycisphaerales bacterium]|nr:serine phosphatase [Phycisphaerales bacterium]